MADRLPPIEIMRSAWLSDDLRYRWHLTRSWGHGSHVCFVMLNPSTADVDDQTITKCIGFARRLGQHQAITVVNLFALRSRYPEGLVEPGVDPVGSENDSFVGMAAREAVESGGMVVAAWGTWTGQIGRLVHDRVVAVSKLLDGVPMYALAKTKNGDPRHPCMLGYDVTPTPYPGG